MSEKKESKRKIGLISLDKVGAKMAGPGIRYLELGRHLAKKFDTTLFVPDGADIKERELKISAYDSTRSSKDLGLKIRGLDVIIAQSLRPPLIRKIKSLGIKYIADLYDPLTIEVLEYTKDDNQNLQQSTFEFNYYSLIISLLAADHVLCASEKQKDYYTGFLSGQKILNPSFYHKTPNLVKFISIAPFGLPDGKATPLDNKAFFSKFPGISKDDKIVYWGGGIWNWFDPLSVIIAIEKLSKNRKDIKLFFLGTKHPNQKIKTMKMASEALEYSRKHDLFNKCVFFNFDWTPYNERVNYLGLATIGISTHFDNIETRFSFRTRILDYLWAELPMILTRGDSMADLCEKNNLGVVVDFENPEEIKNAIEKIVDSETIAKKMSENIKRVKSEYRWQRVAETVGQIISEDRWMERDLCPIKFATRTFDFYFAGLKKKLAK
jgi:glycosyltransferase involved in cell wall biosynthesis